MEVVWGGEEVRAGGVWGTVTVICQSLWLRIPANCDKLLERWEYQTTGPASWEICMQIKKQQLEVDMEQQTGSK